MDIEKEVEAVIAIMRSERQDKDVDLSVEAFEAGKRLANAAKGIGKDAIDAAVKSMKEELPVEAPYDAVWWYSILIGMKKDSNIFEEFVRYVRQKRHAFSLNTQYFLFYQLSSLLFLFYELDGDGRGELWHFYQEIAEGFAECVDRELLEEIPLQERKKDFVLVITEQFLAEQHGPTKTALDRCKVLMERMHKKVLLINDAEVLSLVGAINYYERSEGMYIEQLCEKSEMQWKGVSVPFFQCQNNMPDIETLNVLLREIRKMAPERVITIGKGGILGALVSRMVPSLTVGLCFSVLEYTCAKYQTFSRSLKEAEIKLLASLGYTEEHIIESVFTFSLKPQAEHITRRELGVPEDSFLIIVVGMRLDEEVTEEFLAILEEILTPDMYVGFLGVFSKYDERISGFPKLKEQASFLGFCYDILSRMEVCDLYVNPIRKGGGTSGVEALFKGIPVVTVDYGDVSVAVGSQFCVADYQAMQEQILRYHDDREYYSLMSQKAKERAEILLDSDSEFVRILQEMDKRESRDIEREKIVGKNVVDRKEYGYDALLDMIQGAMQEGRWEDAYKGAAEAVERNVMNLRANFYLAVSLANCEKWLESYRYFLVLQTLQRKYGEMVISEEECANFLNFAYENLQATMRQMPEKDWQQMQWELSELKAADKSLENPIFSRKDDMQDYFGPHYWTDRFYYVGRYDNWFNSNWNPNTNLNGQSSKGEIYEIEKMGKEFEVRAEFPSVLPFIANVNSAGNKIVVCHMKNQKTVQYDENIQKTYSYIRINDAIQITGENDMAFGKPILLRHSPERKKLVLNIFCDSFNWKYIKDYGFEKIMPNTARFFEEGIVCERFFCGSEYTAPSMASYWTGLRSTHHGVLSREVHFPISSKHPMLSEIFHDRGYVTAKIGGNVAIMPNYGYMRGMDRMVYERAEQNFHASDAVSEVIKHLEAFGEADNFILMELFDTHEVAGYWPAAIDVQTHCEADVNEVDNVGGSSLYQTMSPNRRVVYGEVLRHMDVHLESLYHYIKTHYRKDEVVVAFFSDHGNGFNVETGQPFMSDQRTNVPLLIYADGEYSHVCNEKIETIDYGHILCHLCGIKDGRLDAVDGQLPRFFGGEREREYVFSQSLYPDRYYEAAVISDNYKFYFKSSQKVTNDCRISLKNGTYQLWDANGQALEDEKVVDKCVDIIWRNLGDYRLD